MDKKQAWLQLVREKSEHYLNLHDGGFDEKMRARLVDCDYEAQTVTYAFPTQDWQINEKGGIHGGAIAGMFDTAFGVVANFTAGDNEATHNGLCCDPIMNYGTPEQKAKYLPMLTKGHHVGAFALTEPNAGSDASKGQTEAKLEGDHYVMNGSKIFITNGYVADVFVVFAMTDKSKGTKGISAFIVESSFPGFSVGKHEEKLGLHGSPTAEIVFQDCIVPKENLLGVEGKGFSIAMATLDGGRIGIAAQSLGIAEGALQEAINYTKGRVQFGKPISKFQNTQFTLADMELGCEAGRLLTYQAAIAKGEGKRYTKQAAMAKLFTSEHAMKTTTKVVQMFGGYGYTKDYPVERMMRDAKITEIYEGTSEVQRIVISANMGL